MRLQDRNTIMYCISYIMLHESCHYTGKWGNCKRRTPITTKRHLFYIILLISFAIRLVIWHSVNLYSSLFSYWLMYYTMIACMTLLTSREWYECKHFNIVFWGKIIQKMYCQNRHRLMSDSQGKQNIE